MRMFRYIALTFTLLPTAIVAGLSWFGPKDCMVYYENKVATRYTAQIAFGNVKIVRHVRSMPAFGEDNGDLGRAFIEAGPFYPHSDWAECEEAIGGLNLASYDKCWNLPGIEIFSGGFSFASVNRPVPYLPPPKTHDIIRVELSRWFLLVASLVPALAFCGFLAWWRRTSRRRGFPPLLPM